MVAQLLSLKNGTEEGLYLISPLQPPRTERAPRASQSASFALRGTCFGQCVCAGDSNESRKVTKLSRLCHRAPAR